MNFKDIKERQKFEIIRFRGKPFRNYVVYTKIKSFIVSGVSGRVQIDSVGVDEESEYMSWNSFLYNKDFDFELIHET